MPPTSSPSSQMRSGCHGASARMIFDNVELGWPSPSDTSTWYRNVEARHVPTIRGAQLRTIAERGLGCIVAGVAQSVCRTDVRGATTTTLDAPSRTASGFETSDGC